MQAVIGFMFVVFKKRKESFLVCNIFMFCFRCGIIGSIFIDVIGQTPETPFIGSKQVGKDTFSISIFEEFDLFESQRKSA